MRTKHGISSRRRLAHHAAVIRFISVWRLVSILEFELLLRQEMRMPLASCRQRPLHGFLRIAAIGLRSLVPNQLTEACGWEQIPRYLIRERDRAYGEIFVRRVRSIGIRDRPTSFRSPWQNAYAERLIGSIRRECTDHIVIFGERHLRHVLLSYMGYCNGTRTHLSLNKDAPISRLSHRPAK
jgi:hypothetical protein